MNWSIDKNERSWLIWKGNKNENKQTKQTDNNKQDYYSLTAAGQYKQSKNNTNYY